MKILGITLLFMCLGNAAMASAEKLSGRDAVALVSLLNDSGVVNEVPNGTQPPMSEKFFKEAFDPAACGEASFRAIWTHVQTGKVSCRHGEAVWDIHCVVQSRGPTVKTVTVRGRDATMILHLLDTAHATSKSAGEKGETETTVPSLDCTFEGHKICKGSGVCSFP